jgi:pilus assembly protein CpaC
VVIEGSVDDPAHVSQIVEIAKDFYPDVINCITVGGVQQIMLHVKVMEVSRTKLRQFGFDWHHIGSEQFAVQTVSGLIQAFGGGGTAFPPAVSGGATYQFGVVHGSSTLFGVLNCLRQNNLAKVLAEPVLVTVSGRPAFFNDGGEFPHLIAGAFGQPPTVDWKKFGTQVDFVPVVLSNGHIRLEVRPRVSEIDSSRGDGGLRVREVDTGVELRAGETLAIAGLVQTRMEATTRGLPWLMDVPYLGAAFRHVHHEENEIELLVLVTPELVHGLQSCEVPPCGPGLATTAPSDHELHWKAYLEVPKCCGPDCGPGGYGPVEAGMPMGPVMSGEGEMVPSPGYHGNGTHGNGAPVPPKSAPAPMPPMGQRPRPGIPQASSPPRPMPANRTLPPNPTAAQQTLPRREVSATPGLFGPTGYDVRN